MLEEVPTPIFSGHPVIGREDKEKSKCEEKGACEDGEGVCWR
jgi:hypothetical protein